MDARVGEPGDRSRNVDYVVPVDPIEAVELDPIAVTDVEIRQQSVSFSVDQIGVPVLVRVSYFPNWSVEGAEGPYRVSPNHMVVIPTSNDVTLNYGRNALDWFFYALTALGIGLCFVLRRRGDVVYASERPDWRPPQDDVPEESTTNASDVLEVDPTPLFLPEPLGDPVGDPADSEVPPHDDR